MLSLKSQPQAQILDSEFGVEVFSEGQKLPDGISSIVVTRCIKCRQLLHQQILVESNYGHFFNNQLQFKQKERELMLKLCIIQSSERPAGDK